MLQHVEIQLCCSTSMCGSFDSMCHWLRVGEVLIYPFLSLEWFSGLDPRWAPPRPECACFVPFPIRFSTMRGSTCMHACMHACLRPCGVQSEWRCAELRYFQLWPGATRPHTKFNNMRGSIGMALCRVKHRAGSNTSRRMPEVGGCSGRLGPAKS